MKNNELKIGIDIDDTSIDFVGTYILFYNQKYNKNLKRENVQFYNSGKPFGIINGEPSSLINEFYNSKLFMEITPFPNAFETMKKLKQAGYNLISITSRPDSLRATTENLLERCFPNIFSDLFFSYNHYTKMNENEKSKAEICLSENVSHIIDDSLTYCIQCAERGIEALLFGNYHWNKGISKEIILPEAKEDLGNEKIHRVKDWLAVGEKLLK